MTTSLEDSTLILDAWPVLEWLRGREPVAGSFHQLLNRASLGEVSFRMTRINYGEVLYMIRKTMPQDKIAGALLAFHDIGMDVHSIDDALVDEAVLLKGAYPFSYADAFAAALALRFELPLVTGDTEFLALVGIGLKLHWLGQ